MGETRSSSKMKIFNNNKIILLFRVILGLVFIYASIDKILDPAKFSDLIDNYHVTPIEINNFAAILLPWIELIIGICLITGVFINGAIILSVVLLFWFIIILIQALFRGINLDCGCFNLVEQSKDINLRAEMISRIIQDIIFLFMAFIIKNRK